MHNIIILSDFLPVVPNNNILRHMHNHHISTDTVIHVLLQGNFKSCESDSPFSFAALSSFSVPN